MDGGREGGGEMNWHMDGGCMEGGIGEWMDEGLMEGWTETGIDGQISRSPFACWYL